MAIRRIYSLFELLLGVCVKRQALGAEALLAGLALGQECME